MAAACRTALLLGTTSGVPVSGSGMTRQSTSNTDLTSSASSTSAGAPGGGEAAVLEDHHVVRVTGGLSEIVQHHHHGAARLGVQGGDQVEDVELVPQIEEGGRLVEQQQLGVLRQRQRDPGALALTAGQLVDGLLAQGSGAGALQSLVHRLLVGGRPGAQQPLVRIPAQAHQRLDGDRLRRDRLLREQTHAQGQRPGGHPVDVGAVEGDHAGGRREQSAQPPQQGGLSTGVGADDRRDGPTGQRQVEAAHHEAVAVAQVEALGGELVGGGHVRLLRTGGGSGCAPVIRGSWGRACSGAASVRAAAAVRRALG